MKTCILKQCNFYVVFSKKYWPTLMLYVSKSLVFDRIIVEKYFGRRDLKNVPIKRFNHCAYQELMLID